MAANFRKAKKEAKELVPDQFIKDPFDVLGYFLFFISESE